VLRAHKRAVAEGGELRLVVPADGAVPRILNLTGLDLFLPCFSSLAGALAPALAPGGPAQLGALAGLPSLRDTMWEDQGLAYHLQPKVADTWHIGSRH
jgi:hypothetical protein